MAEDKLREQAERSRRLPEEKRLVIQTMGPLSAKLIEESRVSPGGAMLAYLSMAADCAYHHALEDGDMDEQRFVELAKIAYRATVLGHRE
jgi:hypothetical protein